MKQGWGSLLISLTHGAFFLCNNLPRSWRLFQTFSITVVKWLPRNSGKICATFPWKFDVCRKYRKEHLEEEVRRQHKGAFHLCRGLEIYTRGSCRMLEKISLLKMSSEMYISHLLLILGLVSCVAMDMHNILLTDQTSSNTDKHGLNKSNLTYHLFQTMTDNHDILISCSRELLVKWIV